jgi:hypothetical protein
MSHSAVNHTRVKKVAAERGFRVAVNVIGIWGLRKAMAVSKFPRVLAIFDLWSHIEARLVKFPHQKHFVYLEFDGSVYQTKMVIVSASLSHLPLSNKTESVK